MSAWDILHAGLEVVGLVVVACLGFACVVVFAAAFGIAP